MEQQNNAPHRNIVQVKTLQGASRSLAVYGLDPEQGLYIVESASQPGVSYTVQLKHGALSGSCTCPWAQHGGINCKHVMAALREHYAEQGALSFWGTRDDAQRQHRRLVSGDRLYATMRPRRRAS